MTYNKDIEKNNQIPRKSIGKICREKHPDKIPIIVKYKNFVQKNGKKKLHFLFNEDHSYGYIISIIRRESSLSPDEGIVVFIDNTIPKGTDLAGALYNKYKDTQDDILYLTVTKENTFG